MKPRSQPPPREFPRDVMLKLPSSDECCTVAETEFWNRTLQMAMNGSRPREVAEYAATALDGPMLVRAYPVIREALNKWVAMGNNWLNWDDPVDAFGGA